jgi:hypothetical protein
MQPMYCGWGGGGGGLVLGVMWEFFFLDLSFPLDVTHENK